MKERPLDNSIDLNKLHIENVAAKRHSRMEIENHEHEMVNKYNILG